MTYSQINSTDLKMLANSVPKYPISVKKLIGIASRKRLSPEVISFYRAFPESITFDDKEDIVTTCEQVNLLRGEPQPVEDVVRGAED
jgi:hypothetical protein